VVCVPRAQRRVAGRMVAEPAANTADATGLLEGHTVAHSVPEGTDQRRQLESRVGAGRSRARHERDDIFSTPFYSADARRR